LKENVKNTAKITKNAKNELASLGYYTIFPQKLFKLIEKKKINLSQFTILTLFVSKCSSLDHNELKFTHGDIAKLTGIHRNTVSTSLSILSNLGFIDAFKNEKEQGQPNTYVLNIEALEREFGGVSIKHKICAKQTGVKHKICAKGLAQNFDTSYYYNNYVIKNLSKGFSDKIIETLEKLKSEKNIEREILLNFLNEKKVEYFNAIQNKANPFTYIKTGFDNWFIDFEENQKTSVKNDELRKSNEIMIQRTKYFSAYKKYVEWDYSEQEILEQLNNHGFDGFEFGKL